MLKTLEQWRLEKIILCVLGGLPQFKMAANTMKGPDIEILINIDFWNLDLWTFLWWGFERNVRGTFLVTKSICESSLRPRPSLCLVVNLLRLGVLVHGGSLNSKMNITLRQEMMDRSKLVKNNDFHGFLGHL